MTPSELLAEYAVLLNEHGVDSVEAQAFLEAHKEEDDFYELAMLSNRLKRALTAPSCRLPACHN